ncbi:hypothetical protein AB0K00_49325 [Dactylosporangium sp. NPDC049525]
MHTSMKVDGARIHYDVTGRGPVLFIAQSGEGTPAGAWTSPVTSPTGSPS